MNENENQVYHMPPPGLSCPPPPPFGGSILNDVKLYCNILQEYKEFDKDIINAINGVLSILVQLGVVSPAAPPVVDDQLPWCMWIPDETRFGMVKLYVQAKVRLLFDPPQSSGLRELLEEQCREFEFRSHIEADTQSEMYS